MAQKQKTTKTSPPPKAKAKHETPKKGGSYMRVGGKLERKEFTASAPLKAKTETQEG